MAKLQAQTYNKHLHALKSGMPLSRGELRGVCAILNSKGSPLQAFELINAALNSNCLVGSLQLVGFETAYDNGYGDIRFKPVLVPITNPCQAIVALKE